VTEEPTDCCGEGSLKGAANRFSVEAVVSVDERGQMVLPKAVRERLGIRAGDKLALAVLESGGRPCCINLIRAEELGELVRGILGPAFDEIR
jgi:antitoxin PrlF